MTLDQLNYLLILAEEQNVTRAAQRLYITQPTLTTFINKLEKELGTKLFDRGRNPVKPTKNGEIYLKKMQELLLAEQQLKEELRYHDERKQRIRIGLGYAHSAMWATKLAQRLLVEYPNLDIFFCEGQEADMMTALRNDEIDVFLGHTEIDPVNFKFEVLFEEPILLLLPRCSLNTISPSAGRNPDLPYMIDENVLADMRMIIPGSAMGLYLNAQLLWKQYRINPPSIIQSKNTLTSIQMAANGLGFMLGNEELIRFLQPEDKDKIVYCTLPGMSKVRKYYYGYSENNPQKDLIEKVLAIMKNIVSDKNS